MHGESGSAAETDPCLTRFIRNDLLRAHVLGPTASTFPAWFTQQLRVGYYSAVTHMDWHFGMVLKALEETGQADDTIVRVPPPS